MNPDERSTNQPSDNLPPTPGAPKLDAAAARQTRPAHDQAPVQPEPTGPVFQPTMTARPTDQPDPSQQRVTPVQPAVASPARSAKAERRARTQYLKQVNRNRPRKSHTGRNVSIIVIILLLAGAAAAYFWWWQPNHQPAKSTTQQPATGQAHSQSQPATPPPSAEGTIGANGQVKEYNSSNFSLSLEYPASWTPHEQNGILTVTSPVADLTDASGNSVKGKVILTVEPTKQADLKPFDAGQVVAVLKSERIKYANPTTSQRGASYISFLQYPSTTTKGGMDAIYVTGDAGYQYAGVVDKADIQQVEPLIRLTFIGCANDDCPSSTQAPLSLTSDIWKQDNFRQPLVKMLESFRFE